jgi:hypothetical protein
MTTITHDGLEVCIDCVLLIANDDSTDEHRALVAAQWPTGDLVLAYAREEDEDWFSWGACDGCGSTLGGDRHPAVVFAREN